MVAILGTQTGWLGWQRHEARETEKQRSHFLHVARQAVVDITSIDHTRAEAGVERILDSATGALRDDFQVRSHARVGVVKRTQVKSEGAVADADWSPHRTARPACSSRWLLRR